MGHYQCDSFYIQPAASSAIQWDALCSIGLIHDVLFWDIYFKLCHLQQLHHLLRKEIQNTKFCCHDMGRNFIRLFYFESWNVLALKVTFLQWRNVLLWLSRQGILFFLEKVSLATWCHGILKKTMLVAVLSELSQGSIGSCRKAYSSFLWVRVITPNTTNNDQQSSETSRCLHICKVALIAL